MLFEVLGATQSWASRCHMCCSVPAGERVPCKFAASHGASLPGQVPHKAGQVGAMPAAQLGKWVSHEAAASHVSCPSKWALLLE